MMAVVERNAIQTILRDLPRLQPATPTILRSNEILIVSSGFEDRALAFGHYYRSDGARAIQLDYLPYDSRNRVQDVAAQLEANGFASTPITFDRFRPDPYEAQLVQLLSDAYRIIIDASAMSKLAILLTLHTCTKLADNVGIFYAEAETYGPSEQEYLNAKATSALHQPSIQLYTGVHGVLRVPALASVAMQGQPSAAIAFMSFNEFLTQALLDCVYPSRLFLINGRPPRLRWREEAMYWIHEQLIREWPSEDNPLIPSGEQLLPARVTSTLEYTETVTELLYLYWTLAADYRILIGPSGSKMQTLATFMVKAMHPDVHIEYPTPKGFLDLYSQGIADAWVVDFPRLSAMLAELRLRERRRIIEQQLPQAG